MGYRVPAESPKRKTSEIFAEGRNLKMQMASIFVGGVIRK